MAVRHPLILDSDGLIKEIGSSDIIDLSNNIVVGSQRIDTNQLRIFDGSEVAFSLPQNRGYFGQTFVTDSAGVVSWQSIDSVQFSDSELLFAFNNSIAELDHNYQSADSDQFDILVDYIDTADQTLQTQITAEVDTRISNVSSLLSLIQTETTNRRNADSDNKVLYVKESDEFLPAAGQTSFTLSYAPEGAVAIFRNGMRIKSSNVAVSGTLLNYNVLNISNLIFENGDDFIVDYIRIV